MPTTDIFISNLDRNIYACVFCQHVMHTHVNDSNKHDVWIIIKSINIGENNEVVMNNFWEAFSVKLINNNKVINVSIYVESKN